MKKNKLKLYISVLVLVLFLFFILFASNINTRLFLTIFLILYTFIINFIIKKRSIKSIYDKHILIFMLVAAIIYLSILYALGLHYGYIRSKYYFNINLLFKTIIPISIIITLSELIRNIFISQDGTFKIKGHKIDLLNFLVLVAMLLIDYIVFANMYSLTKLDDFLTVMGFIVFSSVANNLLFNYLTKKFGPKSIILFKLITVLYVYIIPYQPDIYLFLTVFIRMIYPFLIYLIVEKAFAKRNFALSKKKKVTNIIFASIAFTTVVLMILLISCQFRFGIIVIGSDSMTGTINKGDAIIYEKYDHNKKIQNGQVIIFDHNNIKTIHRVVDIKTINDETRYYTKGDANKLNDTGYRTQGDVDGLVKLKIKYIGLPTLWLRSIFK